MNYYAHTISARENFMIDDIGKLEDVLKSGYILSRRKLKLSEGDALFNGMDFISLCDLMAKRERYSAYNLYTKKGISLLFDHDIEVIKPTLISPPKNDFFIACDYMHKLGKGKVRYSDLPDEVQVKDELSLAYLRALSLSLKEIQRVHRDNYIESYLDVMYSLTRQYNYPVPIINLDDEKVLKK